FQAQTPPGPQAGFTAKAACGYLQRAGDFLDFEELEGVAFLDVVVVLDAKAAFEAFANFLDIVLEALEAFELAGVDDNDLAQQAQTRAATYHAAGDYTARDRADLGGHEHLTDLGRTDDLFALLGCQHAGHGRLHLIHGVVDDVVVAQIDAIVLSQLARTCIGPGVEPDDDRLGRDCQIDVGFADAADGRMHDLHPDLVGRQLEQRRGQCFLRTLHVGLDDEA